MFTRYKSELDHIFTDEYKLGLQVKIELEWMRTLSKARIVLKRFPTVERVQELEKQTKHDVAAVILAVEEQCPIEYKKYVHLGLTSQDINDTTLALQMKEADLIMNDKIVSLIDILSILSKDKTPCIGRTHGQHAIPMTIGHKFENYLNDILCIHGLLFGKEIRGKLHGAVGTSDALKSIGINHIEVICKTMDKLGLRSDISYTQVTSRVRLVDYFQTLLLFICIIEKIAKELRNLQRTEIQEVYEEYTDKQIGSSAMPQKRNPIASENICGIARVLRSQINPLLETISLEHERDLTNSSVERIEIPLIMSLTCYVIVKMTDVLKTIKVDKERCLKNMNILNGRQYSERILTSLVFFKGYKRSEAHEFLNRDQKTPIREQLNGIFSASEIDILFS